MTVEELNVKVTADISDLKRDLARMEGAVKGSAKKSETAMSGGMKKIGGAIAAAFSVQAIISFSKKVIEVRSEFERFEAVLTNTLGSTGAAKLALLDIKEMAARTPFSVAELSGAFVKLTNYGLQPSMEAMRQYGDLASSVGKGFDQLAEAVADATTGEFERLKEFGIKASKEGDKVTFTFKEQATTVDFTTQAIENYVKGLGELEGVSGSMAAISETLGGSVSNLGDKFDSLLNTIGESSVWKSILSSLGDIVETTEVLINTWDQLPVDELKFWTDTEYSIKQLEKAQKDYNEQLRITAANTATYEAAVKAGATPMGQIPTAEKPFVPISGGFNLMTLDPKTGMPIPVGSTEQAEKSKKLTKEEIKAREKAKEEMIDFANAMNDVTRYLEGNRKLSADQLAAFRREREQFKKFGVDGLDLADIGIEEEAGIDEPFLEEVFRSGTEGQKQFRLEQLKSKYGYDPKTIEYGLLDANEAMFNFESAAGGLAQGLLDAARGTQDASVIFSNAIGQVITQLLSTQIGAMAGPLGGLVGGLIGMTIKGSDLETSRNRSNNTIARYN